jgi:siderophore synthetase component
MKLISEVPAAFTVQSMNEEERKVFHMLKAKAPHLTALYTENLPIARAASLQRVLMCLLREDTWNIFSRACDLHVAASIIITELPPVFQFAEAAITGNDAIEDGWYKGCLLHEGELLLIPVHAVYAFRRVETGTKAIYIQGSTVKEIEFVTDLLALLPAQISFETLIQEMKNSSANLALSYAYEKYKQKHAVQEESTIHYVLQEKRRNALFCPDLFFEQMCTLGHNLHPCTKTKMGMKAEAVFAYSPEFEHPVPLRFAALHKKYAEQTWAEGNEEILLQAFPELQICMERELKEADLPLQDYVVIPVHPWQLEHVIPAMYEEELLERILVPIQGTFQSAYATASFRTLLAGELAIKTAVHSQMTSTIRSISPQTANNAALFTKVMKQIMEREPGLQRSFVPVYELGGGSFRSEEEDKKRNLSFVVREPISRYTSEEEVAVVGSALYHSSITSGRPILLDVLLEYEREAGILSDPEAALRFFSEYACILLEGCLTLMTKYGIGLEAHLQNIVPVFKNGRPIRMLFRDWGGARIYLPRLQKSGIVPSFYPGSLIVTDSIKEMHNKVFYTTVQNHLGEIIYLLCQGTKVSEQRLWSIAKHVCNTIFAKLEQEYGEEVKADRAAFYAEQTDYKALLTMRLREGTKGYSYVQVENPLADTERIV